MLVRSAPWTVQLYVTQKVKSENKVEKSEKELSKK